MSDFFSVKTAANLFLKLLKHFKDKITKFFFYKAYELSRVEHAFMNLDKTWKDLGPIQYLIHINYAHNPISKNGNYIAIKSKNKDEKFYKIEMCVTLSSRNFGFQQSVVGYNIGKEPTIISLDGLPNISMYFTDKDWEVYSEYQAIETSLHAIFKIDAKSQNLINSNILSSGKSHFTFYDILNSINEPRWGEKWNLDLIKEAKINIKNPYFYYCFNKSFLRSKNMNLVQVFIYYLSDPRYFLYLILRTDFLVNVIFWYQNAIKPRGLEKFMKKKEFDFLFKVKNKDLFFYHLSLLSK